MQASQPTAILAITEISERPIRDQIALWKILSLYMAFYGALTERHRAPASVMGVLAQMAIDEGLLMAYSVQMAIDEGLLMAYRQVHMQAQWWQRVCPEHILEWLINAICMLRNTNRVIFSHGSFSMVVAGGLAPVMRRCIRHNDNTGWHVHINGISTYT